ncbi:hypothetical protein V5O48_001845 [Marasmius crinis-equi]|uniref:Ubiquitin-like protease family profile domain-containing protein n=1 Tax=Marasmius crinis-equi TaxID=585013 RepID=A0ABR3FYI6_9AGAR
MPTANASQEDQNEGDYAEERAGRVKSRKESVKGESVKQYRKAALKRRKGASGDRGGKTPEESSTKQDQECFSPASHSSRHTIPTESSLAGVGSSMPPSTSSMTVVPSLPTPSSSASRLQSSLFQLDPTQRYTDILQLPWETAMMDMPSVAEKVAFVPEEFRTGAWALFMNLLSEWQYITGQSTSLSDALRDGKGTRSQQAMYSGIMGLRLLDKLCALRGCPKNPRASLRAPFSVDKTLRGYPDLIKWAEGLRHVQRLVQDDARNLLRPPPPPTQELEHVDGAEKEFRVLMWQFQLVDKSAGCLDLAQILNNISSAAFFISYFKAGHADLPSSTKSLQDILTDKAYTNYPHLRPLVERVKIRSQVSPMAMRSSVYAALTVSPLILISRADTVSGDLARIVMIHHWLHLGNQKPELVVSVEDLMWACVLRVVEGTNTPLDSLNIFLNEVMPRLDAVEAEAVDFFDPGHGETAGDRAALFHAFAHNVEQKTNESSLRDEGTGNMMADKLASEEHKRVSGVGEHVEKIDVQGDGSIRPESSSPELDDPCEALTVPKDKGLPMDVDGIDSANDSRTKSLSTSTEPVQQDHTLQQESLSAENAPAQLATAAKGAGKDAEPSSSSGGVEKPRSPSSCLSGPESEDEDEPQPRRSGRLKGVDASSASKAIHVSQEVVKSSKCSGQKGAKKETRAEAAAKETKRTGQKRGRTVARRKPIVRARDSLAAQSSQTRPRVDLSKKIKAPFEHRCILYGYSGDVIDVVLRFHLSEYDQAKRVSNDLKTLLDGSNLVHEVLLETAPFSDSVAPMSDGPGPMSLKPHPALRVMQWEEFSRMDRNSVQRAFGVQNLLLRNYPVPLTEQRWDPDVIGLIGNMLQDRQMHDMQRREQPHVDPDHQIVTGTLMDVYYEGLKEYGLQLNVLQLPGTLHGGNGFFLPDKLWSCGRAHADETSAEGFEQTKYPEDSASWHLLATKNCSSEGHVDTNGYGSMIAPQTGAKLVFLLVPGSQLPSYVEVNSSLQFARFDENLKNEVGMVPIGIVLRPGDVLLMRPCTPHYVVTLENSLCHGSHFYTSTTMSDTCLGVLHTFTHHNHITNQSEVSHRATLARIMCFWASCLVGSDYFQRKRNLADVPDFGTSSGIFDFLSLYNVIKLGSVLWTERYEGRSVNSEHRDIYARASRAADSLLCWLDEEVTICSVGGRGVGEIRFLNGQSAMPSETRIAALRDRFLVHQCVALYNAIQNRPEGASSTAIKPSLFRKYVVEQFKTMPNLREQLREELTDPVPEVLSFALPDRFHSGEPTHAHDYNDDPQWRIRREIAELYSGGGADKESKMAEIWDTDSEQNSLRKDERDELLREKPSGSVPEDSDDSHVMVGELTPPAPREPLESGPGNAKRKPLSLVRHEDVETSKLPVREIEGEESAGEGVKEGMDVVEAESKSTDPKNQRPFYRPRPPAMSCAIPLGITRERRAELLAAQKEERKRRFGDDEDDEGADECGGDADSSQSSDEAENRDTPSLSEEDRMHVDDNESKPGAHKNSDGVEANGGLEAEDTALSGPVLMDQIFPVQNEVRLNANQDEAPAISSPRLTVKRPRETDELKNSSEKRMKVDGLIRMTWVTQGDLNIDRKPAYFRNLPQFVEKDSIQNRTISAFGSSFQISSEDLVQLEIPVRWITDNCLEGAARALWLLHLPRSDECAYLASGIVPHILGRKRADQDLRALLRRSEYWRKETWLLPLHIDENHWSLVVFKPKQKKIWWFDSLHDRKVCERTLPDISYILEKLIQLVTDSPERWVFTFPDLLPLSEWEMTPLEDHILQKNYYDCGIWVLWVVAALFRGFDYAVATEDDIAAFRKFLLNYIQSLPAHTVPPEQPHPAPATARDSVVQDPVVENSSETTVPVT